MEQQEIKNIIETLLFITDEPISIEKFKDVFLNEITENQILESIQQIKQEHISSNSPIELKEIAGGYQFATKKEYGPWIRRLFKEKITLRLSPPSLETLSIIAYKQPITRAEIEEIRGVDSSGPLETLLERKLIRITGRKETVGRPLLYSTTKEFLRYFGLNSLSDLPSLEELEVSSFQPQEELFQNE